ncbi:Threonine dehydratase I [gamma proteobacterium HdN1]|nr:Threonine dehydratase I [gamma proteobacterium HdN1]
MPAHYIKRILSARVYDVAEETPLDPAPFLSQRLNNRVLLKREDLQPVFSFKIRGAYNKIVNLSAEEREHGVVAASAGNHAQGVALAATKLGIKSTIVMPKTTPDIKVAAVKALGGKVVLHGDTFDQAYAHVQELIDKHGYTLVHPYDDPDVIAGQGTIGMEIVRQHSGPLHAVFVPVGGGGLLAGVGAYLKYLRPETRLIGVEPEDAASLKAALEANARVILPQVGLFADGVAVAQIGAETFRVIRRFVDEVITVTSDEICAAVKDVYDDTRSITEPAGALALAGLKKYVQREGITEQTLVAINSGANVNFDRLRHIAERTELGERREALFAVTIPERPGSFRKFCQAVGRRNITEFNYRFAQPEKAHVFVGLQARDASEIQSLMEHLADEGYVLTDFSDNEMAKLHIRHLVGGRGSDLNGQNSVPDEVLFRFEFPERPGALLEFLSRIGSRWNISLFHYRNHGAAYGRVLVGMQVPETERLMVKAFFEETGYQFWDESDNIAYQLFLK